MPDPDDEIHQLQEDRRRLIKERDRLQEELVTVQASCDRLAQQLRAIKASRYMPPDWWEPREAWMEDEEE